MRPTVPSPGHGEGCDGGRKAMQAGSEMGAVHRAGQGWCPFVHREVFHERFEVTLVPMDTVLSHKAGPQSWALGCWRSLGQDGHGVLAPETPEG